MKARRETAEEHDAAKRRHRCHLAVRRELRSKHIAPAVRAEIGEPTKNYGRGRDRTRARLQSVKRAFKFEERDEQVNGPIELDPEDYFTPVFPVFG